MILSIMQAWVDRIKNTLGANTELSINPTVGSKILKVVDANWFNVRQFHYFPMKACFWSPITGITIPVDIYDLDLTKEPHTIELLNPLTGNPDFPTIENGYKLYRAPNYMIIQAYYIGDVASIPNYPAISVIPNSEDINFTWLPAGADHNFTLQFMAYTLNDGQEQSQIQILELARDLKEVIMSDLHINAGQNPHSPLIVFDSRVNRVDYGTVAKGSEFYKAAQINWFGKVAQFHNLDFLYRRNDTPFDPPTLLNVGKFLPHR